MKKPEYHLALGFCCSPWDSMSLKNQDRIREINELVQKEQDPKKLSALVEELIRLLDEQASSSKPSNPSSAA